MRLLNLIRHRPPLSSTPEDEEKARQHTLSLSVVEGSCWSFMAGFGDTYIAPFAIFLQAGNRAIAFLSTMPALLGALAQLAGASMTDRLGHRRTLIVPCTAVQALAYLPLFLLPFFFPSWGVLPIIAFTALAIFAGNMAAPAWISLMGDVVPEARRGDYFGHRGRIIILFVFLATLSAGGTLSLFQNAGHTWGGFGVLFAVAALARLISVRLLALHYDPPYKPPHEAYFSFWDFIRRMPHSNFARFALFGALMNGSITVASPFFSVYMLRDLHWSYSQFTLNAAVFLATQFFLIRWWGRIGDRHGNRVVIMTTGLVLPVLPLLWTLSSNFVYLMTVQVLSGTFWAGFSIATQNFTYDAVTPPKRARITAYVSILNGLCTIAGGTLLGAYLANHLPASFSIGPYRADYTSSLPGVFVVSAILRFLVVLIFLPMFKEVRSAVHIHPVNLLLRLAGGELLAGFFGQFILSPSRKRERK
ncbi:MAG TPA: hypothetical protein DCZ95_03950 [Verrucomicrobia bacterium]|nr:hypothetical protein [Verrucomicrobiota bacterium]